MKGVKYGRLKDAGESGISEAHGAASGRQIYEEPKVVSKQKIVRQSVG